MEALRGNQLSITGLMLLTLLKAGGIYSAEEKGGEGMKGGGEEVS
jgi:hypothetical protein